MDKFYTMDNLRLWHKFLQTIKPIVGSDNYKAWFLKTSLKSYIDEKIILSTPHAFIKETLSQKYLPIIETNFANLLGKNIQIEFIVKETEVKTEENEEDFFQPTQAAISILNPKYTLENFVVGPSNNVAFAGAQAVAQNPGNAYNPLFLYGGTGVGKTHLMIGIGNTILKNKPRASIIYCSSESFMNDYVSAIQNHNMIALRKKYRMADVFLVDDIQFFSGREGTQEEFFHTFNELQGKNSQMVITSDRPPVEIAKMEDRLKSRFAGGLMVDIQSPNFDTRMAILRAKCLQTGVNLPEDALSLLASSIDTNIRELEGKLAQILQALKARNLEPSTENVSLFLAQKPRTAAKFDHKKVISVICSYFNLSLKDLTGPKRQKELVLPRHLTMYILSDELKLTVEKIGQLLGGRDHTTVMHGRDRIKRLINVDREVQQMLIEVKQKIIS